MTTEQQSELQAYANTHGRTWKAQLKEEWMQGKDTLRWARNTIGPSGLDKIRIQPMRKYFLLLVRDSKSEPWRIEFGDYESHVVKEEAIEYVDSENLEGRSANARVVMCESSKQIDIEAFVHALNVKEGLIQTEQF